MSDMQTCDVALRPCTAADLLALEAWAPTGNSRTHAKRFSHQEAGTSTYFLATCQQDPDTFVGSCEVRWDGCAASEVPGCPEVNGLQVWPEVLRSQGIGTQMLGLLEAEAKSRGHDFLGLGVDDSARSGSTCGSATSTRASTTSTGTPGSTGTRWSTTSPTRPAG